MIFVFVCDEVSDLIILSFFLFNDTATTEIYTYGHTLSLHDALPSSTALIPGFDDPSNPSDKAIDARPNALILYNPGLDTGSKAATDKIAARRDDDGDRKSTRLNSRH